MPVRKLTRVDCLNDYVAILLAPSSDVLKVDERYKNEGMVVGVGPDVMGAVNVGDFVTIRQNNYTVLKPDDGPYAGLTVALVHKPDLITRLPKRTDSLFEVEG